MDVNFRSFFVSSDSDLCLHTPLVPHQTENNKIKVTRETGDTRWCCCCCCWRETQSSCDNTYGGPSAPYRTYGVTRGRAGRAVGRRLSLVNVQSAGRDRMTPITHDARRGWS